jgi:hypothetical protein
MSNEVANSIVEVADTVADVAVPAQKAVNVVTRTFFKGVGKVKRFSPELLMVVGAGAIVTAGVLACRATLKLETVVEKAEFEAELVKEAHKREEYDTETAYTKALSKVYVTRALEIGKLYAVPLSVGLVGMGCLMGAHGVMRGRNVAAIAAYKTMESSFGEYRKRVVEELGEEKERDIRFGITEEEIPEFDEKGKQIGTRKQAVVRPEGMSPYAKIFDEYNDNWSHVPGQNQMFLTNQQNWLNDTLNARGYVFLNDVYKSLGFAQTPDGQITGWLRKDHEDSKDGNIDFGLYEIEKQAKRDFINGFEKAVILDFNVDGIIWDKI